MSHENSGFLSPHKQPQKEADYVVPVSTTLSYRTPSKQLHAKTTDEEVLIRLSTLLNG